MKNLFLLFSIIFLAFSGMSQTTSIAGVVNTYASVTEIKNDTLIISSSTGFTVGDKVLIIQMQGATINEDDASTFGDVTSINDAGNYEINRVVKVLSTSSIIVNKIQRTYAPSAIVQLVHIPVYENATITATLTAQPWNGSTGGILALECTGNLTMNAGINLEGNGFRGGAVTTSTATCFWFLTTNGYAYDIDDGEGALKGEGIANYITNKTSGRGAQGNGGGGGNNHNSGGGGGGNATAGGQGGERISPTNFTCGGPAPGVGGKPTPYSNTLNKVFLAGGGGAGHENNIGTSTSGSNGGGLVLIAANTIYGNGNSINVNGAPVIAESEDGAGGGGAGGSVLLNVSTYSGALTINANGSDGGDVSNVGSSNCNGPGGGGSGGVLWVSQSALPGNITLNNNGGVAGTTASTSQANCTLNGKNNATDGSQGITLTDLSWIENTCDIPMTILSATICNSDSLFLEGLWQHSSGIFYDTLKVASCDSIIETTLNVLPLLSSSINRTICAGDSIVVNGMTYKSSVTGVIEIVENIGPNNCDSIITVNLTVLPPIDISTYSAGLVILSNQSGATYQWINCTDVNTPITGATGMGYTASENGNYAVIISRNGCSDTSACISITNVGIVKNSFENDLLIFPNPTTGNFSIDLGKNYTTIKTTVADLNGKIIESKNHTNTKLLNFRLDAPAGIYIVIIEQEDKKAFIRLVKE